MINLTHKMALATVAAVVAGAAGVAAGQGQAASKGHDGPPPPKHERFKHPKVKQGVLTVEGTQGDDTIVLALKPGRPDIVQVDVGDARRNPFHFKRKDIDSIYLDA